MKAGRPSSEQALLSAARSAPVVRLHGCFEGLLV